MSVNNIWCLDIGLYENRMKKKSLEALKRELQALEYIISSWDYVNYKKRSEEYYPKIECIKRLISLKNRNTIISTVKDSAASLIGS